MIYMNSRYTEHQNSQGVTQYSTTAATSHSGHNTNENIILQRVCSGHDVNIPKNIKIKKHFGYFVYV